VPPWGFFVDSSAPVTPCPPPSLLLKKPWCVASLTDLFFSASDHRICPAARRRSPHRLPSATTPSVTCLGEPQLPSPCPADYPIPTGALGEDLTAPRPPARWWESRRCVGSGRWPGHNGRGQQAAVPFRPSELSQPLTCERRRPWAECEAQYCATVLIFSNLFNS
jgi:hypothetical protein